MSAAAFIGAGLITAGFTALGVSMTSRLKRRLRVITALVGTIDFMEAEISYGLTPLTELLPELAARDNVLEDFWSAVSRGWEAGDSFSKVWAGEAAGLELKEQDRLLVEEIGRILGRYDADRQAARLGFIKKKLELSQTAAREELVKNGRLYCVLGVLGGLTIAIILL